MACLYHHATDVTQRESVLVGIRSTKGGTPELESKRREETRHHLQLVVRCGDVEGHIQNVKTCEYAISADKSGQLTYQAICPGLPVQ